MNKRAKINKFIFKNIKLLIIALFAVLMPLNIRAANFNYNDFNWEEFSKNNSSYWEGYCKNGDENCRSEILSNQKKFYVKLYKILSQYQKKGYFIDDNIIIETVFFELTPSTFSDLVDEYKTFFNSKGGAYIIDENESEEDLDIEEAKELEKNYYATEKDTLKTLIKNMISYQANCYGVYKEASEVQADDGSSRKLCDNGVMVKISGKDLCVDKLNNYNLGFWELNSGKEFLGTLSDTEKKSECEKLSSKYPNGTKFVYDNTKTVNLESYWNFLINTSYFDNKAHLQYRFKEKVLDPANVKCLTNDVCDESLKSKGLYNEYENEIKKIRAEIVNDIKSLLTNYGENVSFSEMNVPIDSREYQRKNYYWPIGSSEMETTNNVLFASKDPTSLEIISYYGNRKNKDNEEEMHYGIDIKGISNETNVIAVFDGEIVTVNRDCVSSDSVCNDGYGNHVIISHSNGDYTVYANMGEIDSSIKVGDKALRGQYLGKIGSSGGIVNDALHFEIRIGGNNISVTIDPLSVINASIPRPNFASLDDFSTRYTSLTKEEFTSSIRNYYNEKKCSETIMNVFVNGAENIYDISLNVGVNPELVVVRAIAEGFSPGIVKNNYWGIGCYNGASADACKSYPNLETGIYGFKNDTAVGKYESVLDVFVKGTYAYIGKYWFNPGGSGLGGCYYLPYMKEYMDNISLERATNACSGSPCTGKEDACVKTTDDDQLAYSKYQVNSYMGKIRRNVFGI